MMKATKHGILNLKSFSLSYNPEITDQGVRLLVKAFPPLIMELGLVGFDLGDEAGEAIYQLFVKFNAGICLHRRQ